MLRRPVIYVNCHLDLGEDMHAFRSAVDPGEFDTIGTIFTTPTNPAKPSVIVL
jgi:hypothetical protein